jgi:hypothetical protein
MNFLKTIVDFLLATMKSIPATMYEKSETTE